MTTNSEMIRAQKRAYDFFNQEKSGRKTGISRHFCSSIGLEFLLADQERERAFRAALPFAMKAFAFKKHPCKMKIPANPCPACTAINEFLEILLEAGIEVPE